MPFWGLQKQLGIDVDSWLVRQSMPQPHGQAALCHAFEREWVECGHGLGQTRARRECQLEYEDFVECMQRTKLVSERGDTGKEPRWERSCGAAGRENVP
uniref:NADH dehydrogenase [ubiquinone] iron-sulfur protein 5 n=1 Tax=Ficedula albicollis TaxID=59894 RepID=U3JCU6_FICAL